MSPGPVLQVKTCTGTSSDRSNESDSEITEVSCGPLVIQEIDETKILPKYVILSIGVVQVVMALLSFSAQWMATLHYDLREHELGAGLWCSIIFVLSGIFTIRGV